MTRLLIALAALYLAACASAPTQPLAAAPARAASMDAVATLATNPCEAATAADYTAVITLARQAARRLDAGKLAPERARRVLDLGRGAKADLDRACAGKSIDSAAVQRARTDIASMRATLKD